jgi:hypothetical protein
MTNNQNLSALKITKFYLVFILISIPSSNVSAFLDAGAITFTHTTCPRLKVYEESVVARIKSNLLLLIFWLHIINYNS